MKITLKEKDDRCTRIAKRKYDVWPSAYASGAVVRCRKGKIWKGVKESLTEEEFVPHLMYNPKTGEEEKAETYEQHLELGKAGYTHAEPKKPVDEKKKPDFKKEKESGLHGWFSRQGGKGKSKGWVDCNTCRKDKKTGRKTCKACGREKGEKRAKYPSCRPKPSDCGSSGKGKEWGKRKESIEMKISKSKLVEIIREELKMIIGEEEADRVRDSRPVGYTSRKRYGRKRSAPKPDFLDLDKDGNKDEPMKDAAADKEAEEKNEEISEGLKYHLENNIPLTENIYRIGSEKYFSLFREARKLYKEGFIDLLDEEIELVTEFDIGEVGIFEEEEVPLDFPMYEELTEEKDPPIGKPTKNTGGGKKYKVYVRNPKTGKVKKITYGDSKGGLKGNWNNPEARKSFASRHNCEDKKDRTKAGYWACRAHKDFGTNVPGRFW